MERIETKIILDEIIGRTIGKNESVPFRLVMDARIPRGVKGFLLGRLLEKSSGEGIPARGSGPVYEALLRTLALEHRYMRGDYLADLDHATGFLSSYLVRPRESLLRWILGDRENVPVATMQRKILFVTDYRYLPVLLDASVRKRGLTTVPGEMLQSLISAIDDRVVATHSDAELGLLSRPIFGFVLFGSGSFEFEIPLVVLREFYLEKKLDRFWAEVGKGLGSIQTVNFALFMKCIRGFRHIPVQTREIGPPEMKHETIMEAKTGEQVETAHQEIGNVRVDQPVMPKTTATLPDLSGSISDQQKTLFVNAVFERDTAYYAAVIASLERLFTWKEAALFLSQFYQSNGLDPFADEVVEFTDTIHRRYDGVGRR